MRATPTLDVNDSVGARLVGDPSLYGRVGLGETSGLPLVALLPEGFAGLAARGEAGMAGLARAEGPRDRLEVR